MRESWERGRQTEAYGLNVTRYLCCPLMVAGLHENVAQAVLHRLIQPWRLHISHPCLHFMCRLQGRLRICTRLSEPVEN